MYEQLMNDMSKKTALLNNDNYYIGKNGLKYCKNCKTPMQVNLKSCNPQIGIMDCLCKCRFEDIERNKKEDIERKRQKDIENLRCEAFSDEALRLNTFDTDRYKISCVNALERYCDEFPDMEKIGEGLLLYGDYGTGKTFYASCILNKLISFNNKCLFTNFSKLVAKSSEFGFDISEYLNKYSLVVFDDFGVERSSEYMLQIIYNAVDCRYRAKLPMIITTNLTMAELKNPINKNNERIFSRIIERCYPIKFDIESLRKEETKQRFNTAAVMLNSNKV